jgi:hypothetical protein
MFRSFWIAGFECSCRRADGRRLDVIAAASHDRFASRDYARVRRLGIATVRDGARWHRIEPSPAATISPLCYRWCGPLATPGCR